MYLQIDRKQAPVAGPLTNVSLPSIRSTQLSNGIPLHMIQHGNVEVVTIQVIVNSGKGYEHKVGLANFTARNMQEGTESYTGLELARKLDGYGAWLGHNTGVESIAIQLTLLNKNLAQCLPLLKEVLYTPTFPEDKFEIMRQRTLQGLSVESEKTRFQARKLFGHLLYGPHHPYGSHEGPEEIEQLTLDDITSYHKSYFYPGNFMLTAVGNFQEDTLIQLFERTFGTESLSTPLQQTSKAEDPPQHVESGRHFHQMERMQSTIRLGHPTFKRSHPDYYKMQVVNTILGGYFGSRLMQNIREDKGYTYGIHSGWVSMRHSGYFVVQSDVGNEYVESTIEEVRKEIIRLTLERIESEELDLVKNYLLGRSISERETPFQLSDILRFSLVSGISFDQIDEQFNVIKHIQPDDIIRLSAEHFSPDSLLEVVCGGTVEL